MKIEKLACCLAKPMNAIRDLAAKVNEIIQNHNELVVKVDNFPTDYNPPVVPDTPDNNEGAESPSYPGVVYINFTPDLNSVSTNEDGTQLDMECACEYTIEDVNDMIDKGFYPIALTDYGGTPLFAPIVQINNGEIGFSTFLGYTVFFINMIDEETITFTIKLIPALM